MQYPDVDENIEASRQERLQEQWGLPKTDPSVSTAIHAAEVLMKAVDDHLAGHLAILANPELYSLTYRAFENLFALRQALASEPVPAKAPLQTLSSGAF
jgi:hypothetical protein